MGEEKADWWMFSDVIVHKVVVVLLGPSGPANEFYSPLLRAEYGHNLREDKSIDKKITCMPTCMCT